MPGIPQLQLLIPGLCGPLPDIEALLKDKNCQAIFSEIAKSRLTILSDNNLYALLAHFFLMEETEDFPSAALSLLACAEQSEYESGVQSLFMSKKAIQKLLCSDNYFLHADPVHLCADMDHAILTGSQDLNLSVQEAKQLSQKLHDHFKVDGLNIFAMDASHWYLSVEKSPSLTTTSLKDAIGRNVNFILPSGDSAGYWKQFLNESQMLLHMHECNQQREQMGRLAVNSLWLHGGGCLPEKTRIDKAATEISAIICDDMLLQGLAQYYKLPWYDVNSFYNENNAISEFEIKNSIESFYEKIKNQTKPLLYINTLLPWLNYTDTSMWQQHLLEFYQQWLKPLLVLVRQGRIKLELYPCNNKKFGFDRFYRYRLYSPEFWRNTKIEDYVNTYS